MQRSSWELSLAVILMLSVLILFGSCLMTGCAASQRTAGGDADQAALKDVQARLATVESESHRALSAATQASLASERSVAVGQGGRYSGGAGWMFGLSCVFMAFMAFSTWQHLRSSRDRAKLKGKLGGKAAE